VAGQWDGLRWDPCLNAVDVVARAASAPILNLANFFFSRANSLSNISLSLLELGGYTSIDPPSRVCKQRLGTQLPHRSTLTLPGPLQPPNRKTHYGHPSGPARGPTVTSSFSPLSLSASRSNLVQIHCRSTAFANLVQIQCHNVQLLCRFSAFCLI